MKFNYGYTWKPTFFSEFKNNAAHPAQMRYLLENQSRIDRQRMWKVLVTYSSLSI